MSTLDVIAIIVVLLIIGGVIGYVLFWVLSIIKEFVEEVVRNRRKNTPRKTQFQAPGQVDRGNEDIINDPDFKRTVEYFGPVWRWMALASGMNPVLPPIISFGADGTIYLKKRGYDVLIGGWKAYMAAESQEESGKALKRFERDLFGDYADKLEISVEYIADHLIEFEERTVFSSDFTVSFSSPSHLTTYEKQQLFISELFKTPIID